MTAEYTPTEEEVRQRFVGAYGSAYADAAFTRFLAARDAKVLEDAAMAFPGFAEVQTHGDAVRWLRARAANLTVTDEGVDRG